LRALAVTDTTPEPLLPNIPTVGTTFAALAFLGDV